jgi:flagellar protein FliS
MSQLAAYKDNAVSTQNKGRLIVMLYEGAIKFLKLAIREIEAGNNEAKGQYISRAQDIINELNAVLDMERGGDIAVNLRKLYLFMTGRLAEANTKKDINILNDIIGLMEELNMGWKEIAT